MKIRLHFLLCFLVPLGFMAGKLSAQSTTITLDKAMTDNQRLEATQKVTLSAGFKYTGSNFMARIVQADGGSYAFTEPTESTTLPVNTANPVGTLVGVQGVTPSGASTYSVPLKICPEPLAWSRAYQLYTTAMQTKDYWDWDGIYRDYR
jgi:hypothetical protein